ncbi:hypothetical protein DYB34_008972 [Aphanomyces astaci]|uniref:Uncharacterized protein n=1 Tax=Aphanomyces astaci TaxID=112090 RepID=A0A3R6X214_APHAT|nr:hypothetical protein DYB34_008972 [Aphanomyces astaci]
MHECYYCDAPYVSAVASAVPLTIFCSRCGVRNSGTAGACISCNHTLLSRLESLKHEWTDTANFVARDLGLHVQVRCPGCMTVCAVPASACFRCGACHTCFAAPTVGDVTSFHVARLTRSLSSSVRSLFHTSDHPPPPPRPRSKPTALNQSFFQRFFQPSDSTDESDDDKPLFGSPRRNPPPSSVDNTRTIPVGIRLPQTPHVHRTDSHGVEYMHLPPPPSRQVPVHVMDSYVAPRKSDAMPTSFERDWDLRRLSLSAEEEAKQELDDDDDVLALTVSHTGGIHVSHAHTVHF